MLPLETINLVHVRGSRLGWEAVTTNDLQVWQLNKHIADRKQTMLLSRKCDADETAVARDQLRSRNDVRFVDRTEFCELLVSNRPLGRCDFPSADVRGIYDPQGNFQYLIEEELLFPTLS